jgi:hypothetical protein
MPPSRAVDALGWAAARLRRGIASARRLRRVGRITVAAGSTNSSSTAARPGTSGVGRSLLGPSRRGRYLRRQVNGGRRLSPRKGRLAEFSRRSAASRRVPLDRRRHRRPSARSLRHIVYGPYSGVVRRPPGTWQTRPGSGPHRRTVARPMTVARPGVVTEAGGILSHARTWPAQRDSSRLGSATRRRS